MPLRRKIVLLFLGLAVVPMLIVATFGFFYAAWLAEGVTETRLAEEAQWAAAELTAASERVEQSLARLDGPSSFQDNLDVFAETESGPEPALASAPYLAVRGPEGQVLASRGAIPAAPIRCDQTGGSRSVTISVPLSGRRFALAEVWVADLLTPDAIGRARAVRVLERPDGRVLYSRDCTELTSGASPLAASALAALAAGPSRMDGFRFNDRAGEWNLGSIRATPTGRFLTVASANVHGLLAPLSRMEAWYWFFVLTLTISTALAFSLLLGRVTHSLNELTRAAGRIGEGDFQPWLPPPGNDEVGRLTLAFSDMLERVRRTMEHVDQNGRLAVVGQLSSYLAHEIRNPLTSIKMNLQRLERNARSGRMPADCEDAVEISLREVDRLAGSVTSILQLGRADQGPREIVSLHAVIEEAADLLRGELQRSGISVSVELDASADRVVAGLGQLKGVFLNLMMNALEAQPLGGRLELRSELQTGPDGSPVVAVHVRDYGHGVPKSVRDRIFEPFFTTKPSGSGIGLAVVARTLRDSGGEIHLEDLPVSEDGAEFVVTLPLAAVASEQETVPSSSWRQPRRPREPVGHDRAPEVAVDASEPTPSEPTPILPSDTSEVLASWSKRGGQVH
jgi:signal transduction histidine kinase